MANSSYSVLEQSAVSLATFVDAPPRPILRTASTGDLARLKWLLTNYGANAEATSEAYECIDKLTHTNGPEILLKLQKKMHEKAQAAATPRSPGKNTEK